MASCAAQPVSAVQQPPAAPHEIVYVTAEGWHTGLTVRAADIGGPLAILRQDFPGAQYLWFGWGQRAYYMTRHPTVWDALRALFPGPAVLYVIPLPEAPTTAQIGGHVFPLSVTPSGFSGLTDYIAASFERSADGELRWAGPGFWPGSAFFASNQIYDATNTCNTWTAKALNAAGLPVSAAGVMFASQVVAQMEDGLKSDIRHRPGTM
jgi:uncharacterized protein (TIGR02117 family)